MLSSGVNLKAWIGVISHTVWMDFPVYQIQRRGVLSSSASKVYNSLSVVL